MKKIIALMLTMMMVLSVATLFVGAEDNDSVNVYVSIADNNGKLAVALEEITVTDTDGDEALTISDALYCAHEKFYDGGAAAGYGTEMTKYGLSMIKLWGIANGYNYSYMVNSQSAWNLADPVKDNDVIDAYPLRDLEYFTDKYAYFDHAMDKDLAPGESVDLTLSKIEYDADWVPQIVAAAGVSITVDGKATDLVTDNEGKVKVSFDKPGKHIVSIAQPANEILFPAAYLGEVIDESATPDEATADQEPSAEVTDPTDAPAADVEATADEATQDEATQDESSATKDSTSASGTPGTGDNTRLWLWILVTGVCLCGVVVAVVIYKKNYAKK